jgi:hypothetical protein
LSEAAGHSVNLLSGNQIIAYRHRFSLEKVIAHVSKHAAWQSIETAPKETVVLIFTPVVGVETAICVKSVKRDEPENTFWAWYVGQSLKNGGVTGYTPTHWMPLPEPPTPADAT